MRVLITTDLYIPTINGVVTSVLNLKKELEKRGNEVKILTLSQTHHSYEEDDVTYLASVSADKIYDKVRVAVPFYSTHIRKLEKWQPEIIHSQNEFSTYVVAQYLSFKYDIPLIHTYHSVYEDYVHYVLPHEENLGKKLVSYFTKLAVRKTNIVIAPTDKVKNLLEGYGIAPEVVVIPTGIDVSKFSNAAKGGFWREQKKAELCIDKGKLVFLFAGRIAKEKNIEEILRYMKNIKRDDFVFIIVGGGPYMEEVKAIVEEYNLKDKVYFTGMVEPEQMPFYYTLGDVFVSASTSETQGLTYIEALSAGLPLLCKYDKCLDGVLDSGFNGWGFTNEEEFNEHFNDLCDNKGKIALLRHNSLESARKFSAEAFGEEAEKAYVTAITQKHLEQRPKLLTHFLFSLKESPDIDIDLD